MQRGQRVLRPGASPNTFYSQGAGMNPGAIGQQITHADPFTFAWTPYEIVDWLEIRLGVTAAFAWAAGDGNSPYRGPSLSLTGSPSLIDTPWQDQRGNAIQAEEHTGGSYRNETHTAVDPASGEDVVGVWWMRQPSDSISSTNYCVSTFVSGRGIVLGYQHPNNRQYAAIIGDTAKASVPSADTNRTSSWFFGVFIVDRDGNLWCHTNGSSALSIGTTPSGSLGDGEGVGVGVRPSGSTQFPDGGAIVMGALFYGTGIADRMTQARVSHISHAAMGTLTTQGDQGVFSGDSHASWQNRNGIWHIASNGMPRSGDSGGLRLAPGTRTNKAFRNIDPQDVSALTETGAKAPTTEDDSTALDADGCGAWGPHVYEYDNDTGSTQYIRMSDATGNTNTHCYQCLARVTAGAGTVNFGLYDESAGTFAGSAIHDGYDERTVVNDVTPGDTDCTLALEVPDGVTIRWIAHSLCEAKVCAYPVPNWATAAAATLAEESFEIDSKYRVDGQGSAELDFAPLGWDSSELPGAATYVVSGNAAGDIFYIGGSGNPIFWDSSNVVQISGLSYSDGDFHSVRARWTGDYMSLSWDNSRDDTVYDGSLRRSGQPIILKSFFDDRGEIAVKNFKIYKNGSG